MSPFETIKSAIIGNPYDPNKQPSTLGVVKAFSEMQTQVEGFKSGSIVRSTLADLNALTKVEKAHQMAWVTNDENSENNGIYENIGTPSSPSFEKRTEIPQFIVTALPLPESSANEIVAETDLPLPSRDGSALIVLEITETNTDEMTVVLNGGSSIPILTNSGLQIPVGGLVENMHVAGFVTNNTFRLINDVASLSIQINAAQSAQQAAQSAQQAAQSAQQAAQSSSNSGSSYGNSVTKISNNESLTETIDLNSGESLIGDNPFDTRRSMLPTEAGVTLLGSSAGTPKEFGARVENLFIESPRSGGAYSSTGIGLDARDLGYPTFHNLRVRGAQGGAANLIGVVGANFLFGEYSQTPIAVTFSNPNPIRTNTITKMFGTVFDLNHTIFRSVNQNRNLMTVGCVYQNFSNFHVQQGTVTRGVGYVGFGNWYEAYGDNLTTFNDGVLTFDTSNENGNLNYGKLLQPTEYSTNFTNKNATTIKDAYNPILDGCSFRTTTGSLELYSDNDQFEFRNILSQGWGSVNILVKTQLPVLGELSTPDEKYSKQSVHSSNYITDLGTLLTGSVVSGKTNLIENPINVTAFDPQGYWPNTFYLPNSGQTIQVTTGRNDPFGTNEAITLSGGIVRSNLEDTVTIGDRRILAVAVKANSANSEITLGMVIVNESGGNIVNTSKQMSLILPDTEWHVVYLQYKAVAAGQLRISIGCTSSNSAGIDIFRPNLWEGAKLSPLLREGQSVDGSFIYEFGRVIKNANAIPTTGVHSVGDKIMNSNPTSNGVSYWQCVAAGTPGTWQKVMLTA